MNAQELSTLAREVYVSFQIEELLPPERYEIYVKPDYRTASWHHSGGTHRIVLGDAIFASMNGDYPPEDKKRYFYAYLLHEFAHSLWSERDLQGLAEELREEKIPFALFNLFEDARIEEKMRRFMQKKFNWAAYETLDVPINPVEMFFYILQNEHKPEALLMAKKAMQSEDQACFETVFSYYKAALKAQQSHDLIPILKAWLKEFPLSEVQAYLALIGADGHLFSEESEVMPDAEAFEQLIVGLVNILGDTDANAKVRKPDDRKEHGKSIVHTRQEHSDELLRCRPAGISIDTAMAALLYRKIEALFFEPARYLSTAIAAKRINLKGLTQGSDKLYRRKNVITRRKKEITVVLDLSGSMHATMEHMHLLVHVMNMLAQRKVIDCTLMLSAIDEGKAKYQTLRMPLSHAILERIEPVYEGEGLYNTFMQNIPKLRQSDYVWLFTDGCITDDPIDKGHFRQYGIRTHAMYIGTPQAREYMEASFDHVICEEHVEALADQIFTLIRR